MLEDGARPSIENHQSKIENRTMFWRLFLTYLLLVVTTVALMGLLTFQRAEDVFHELARDIAVAVGAVLIAAVGAAYLLARWFAKPLVELHEGARKLADGDLGHMIRVRGGTEHVELAETFNA